MMPSWNTLNLETMKTGWDGNTIVLMYLPLLLFQMNILSLSVTQRNSPHRPIPVHLELRKMVVEVDGEWGTRSIL